MNLKEIKEMISLMNENDLTELEMERNGLKIRLKKKSGKISSEVWEQGPMPPSSSPGEESLKTESDKMIEIKALMVGTFYRAPSPDAPPFVETGEEIEPEKVICVIEAMKLMNEIKSEVKGKIVKVLVENGHPVEFGQVLFLVEPT